MLAALNLSKCESDFSSLAQDQTEYNKRCEALASRYGETGANIIKDEEGKENDRSNSRRYIILRIISRQYQAGISSYRIGSFDSTNHR